MSNAKRKWNKARLISTIRVGSNVQNPSRLNTDNFITNNIKIPSGNNIYSFNKDKTIPTNAFGEIEFPKQLFRPKYVRLHVETEIEIIETLLLSKWRVEKPDLIIILAGDCRDLESKPVQFKTVKHGFNRLINTRSSWVFTNGSANNLGKFCTGLSTNILGGKNEKEDMNQRLRRYNQNFNLLGNKSQDKSNEDGSKTTSNLYNASHYSFDNYRRASLVQTNSMVKSATSHKSLGKKHHTRTRLIGIACWRKVANQSNLEIEPKHGAVSVGKYPAKMYMDSLNGNLEFQNHLDKENYNKGIVLEPNHAAFLFTESMSIENDAMNALEFKMNLIESLKNSHKEVPSACICIGGGQEILEQAYLCIDPKRSVQNLQQTPVILVENTGGWTDIICKGIINFTQRLNVGREKLASMNSFVFTELLALLPNDLEVPEHKLNQWYYKFCQIIESDLVTIYTPNDDQKGEQLDYVVLKSIINNISYSNFEMEWQYKVPEFMNDEQLQEGENNDQHSTMNFDNRSDKFRHESDTGILKDKNKIVLNKFDEATEKLYNKTIQQLKLSVRFNRVDLAFEILNSLGGQLPSAYLNEPFLNCMLQDKTDFLQIFMHHGLDLEKFLSKKVLTYLYLHGNENRHFQKKVKNLASSKSYAMVNAASSASINRISTKNEMVETLSLGKNDASSAVLANIPTVKSSPNVEELIDVRLQNLERKPLLIEKNVNENPKLHEKSHRESQNQKPKSNINPHDYETLSDNFVPLFGRSGFRFNNWYERFRNGEFNLRDLYLLERQIFGAEYNYLARKNNTFANFYYPYRQIFLWALLSGHFKQARIYYLESKVGLCYSVAAVQILQSMLRGSMVQISGFIIKSIQNEIDYYSENAMGILNKCAEVDRQKTHGTIIRKRSEWGNLSLLEIALSAELKQFISHDATQQLLRRIWYDRVAENNSYTRLLCSSLFPFAIPLTIKFNNKDVYSYICSNSGHSLTGETANTKKAQNHQANGRGAGGFRRNQALKVKNRRSRDHDNDRNRYISDTCNSTDYDFSDEDRQKDNDEFSDYDDFERSSRSRNSTILAEKSKKKKKRNGGINFFSNNKMMNASDFEDDIPNFTKIRYFYFSPVVIFTINCYAHFILTTMFAYMLLMNFCVAPSNIELAIAFWTFTLSIEELRQCMQQRGDIVMKFRKKIQNYWSDRWNKMDALFCTLFSAGFILHVLHNVWYQVEYFIEEHGDGEVSLKTLGDIGSELKAQDLKNIWWDCFINFLGFFLLY